MFRKIRALLKIPLAIMTLVFSLAFLLSLGNPEVAHGQTSPPLPTSTVPPTVAPTSTPERPAPTPARPAATPTLRPAPNDARARANGWILQEVIGNHLNSTIYGVAIAPRLYRSDDDGATWALVKRNPEVTDFVISPADPSVLYSTLPLDCSNDADLIRLARSDDGGATWTTLFPGFALLPLLADPANVDGVIAAGCDGLYHTEDGGWSWSPLSTALDATIWETHRARAMAAVYFADGEEASLDKLYVLATDDEGISVLLFSENGGTSWIEVTPVDGEFSVTAFTIDPWIAGRVWLSESTGIWSTEDQGNYWTLSTRGLEDAIDAGLTDIVYGADETLVLGSGQGIWGKAIEDTSWLAAGTSIVQQQAVESLLLTDSAVEQVWVNTEDGVYRVAR